MQEYKVENGRTYLYDVDEFWWPEGIWMPVCTDCKRGPLSKGETYCGDFNGIKPGQCIKETHPHIQ